MALRTVLDFAKFVVQESLTAGSVAIDATAGNGHDTVFLAQTVGAAGHVYGFDVQEDAIAITRRRLKRAEVADRVTLYRDGHEHLKEHLPDAARGRVGAVTFNLGYLPGGADKSVITRPETTLPALDAACDVLASGGVLTVVLYTGHPGGFTEADAVRSWATRLDQEAYHVLSYRFINQRNQPPRLLVIEKRA